jgi:hypothetical protein
VQELIRILGLAALFAERLDPFVQGMFRELHAELVPANEQELAPGFEQAAIHFEKSEARSDDPK